MAGTLTDAMEIIESLFPMPLPRRRKCEALYKLARAAKGGCIVELGTYKGCGAIALALGTRDGNNLPVYAVDDYTEKQGWAAEPYGPEDREQAEANFAAAGVDVTLIQATVEQAFLNWDQPVALAHWDLGVFAGMDLDFWTWERHVIRGGVYAVHDTTDRTLGSKKLENKAIRSRRFLPPEHRGGGVWAFKKWPTIAICCGMSRSGGTVQYQLTKGILETQEAGIGIGFCHGLRLGHRGIIAFKKEGAETWALDMIRDGRAVGLNIYRDPRDVAVSFMHWRRRQTEMGHGKPDKSGSFEDMLPELELALEWQRAWESLDGVYSVQYEDAINDWALKTMHIAERLDVPLTWADASAIAFEYDVSSNKERTEEQESWMDLYTMLTKAHIGPGGGMVGQWLHELEDEQVAAVEELAGKEWMESHGYRTQT